MPRQFLPVSSLSPEVNTYHMTVVLPVTANGTYPLILKSGIRARVVGASYTTQSGSCTLTFKIDGTNVPSMVTLACNSAGTGTQISDGTDGTNILDFTETLQLTVASASSLTWIYVTLYLRQIGASGGGEDYTDPQGCEFAFQNLQNNGPPDPGSGGGGTITSVLTGIGGIATA